MYGIREIEELLKENEALLKENKELKEENAIVEKIYKKGIIFHQLNERASRKLMMDCAARWGVDSQIQIAIEELAELIVVLAKTNRKVNKSSFSDIINEIADVFIVIHLLRLLYMPIKVDKVIAKKMKLLNKRFEDSFKTIAIKQ